MAGGLIQLMSYGYADKPLISDPEITFFKVIYYKHSLFSIQEQQLNSENDINFGSSTTYKIRHNGDLFFRPMLEINLPSVTVEYEKTLDEYISKYNTIQKINNLDINFIVSNLNTILYNYNPYKFPIYITDNLIINSYYDFINSATIETNFNTNYNNEYSAIIDNVNGNVTMFQQYINKLALNAEPTLENARNLFYSSFNINYLTIFLNKKTYSNDFIIVDDDYYQEFQNNLFNYITSNNDEFSFLYSLINNKNIINNNFSTNNTNSIISNTINFKLQYYFQNMNILYIYETILNSISNTSSKQLKSIAININSIFTNNSYTNNIIPFTNLYDQFDNDILTNHIFHIASGYDLNKKFNITSIRSINLSGNSYDISFNTSDVSLNNNIIYFIFPEKKLSDQDITNMGTLLPSPFTYIGAWNSNILYNINDVVIYNNILYVNIYPDNYGFNPYLYTDAWQLFSFSGVLNPSLDTRYWRLLLEDDIYYVPKGTWDVNISYKIDDMTIYNGNQYICIKNINNIILPNYEDYYDLYYNQFTLYDANIYDTPNLLLPICVLKYNDETQLFDKIELSSLINNTDYVFIYNDVFIFNTTTQKNDFILINDKMYTILDISSNTSYQYSNSIYLLPNPQIIENNTIIFNDDFGNNYIYYLTSTSTSFNFIDQIYSYNYKTFNFISPYQVLYNIDDTHFYNNRLKQINYKNDMNINLDIYNNLIYNQNKLKNINILNKNINILDNLKLTIPENITYIKNILNYFFNDLCFFKEWNSFIYNNLNSDTKITLSIAPTFGTTYYSNIFTTNNINGQNYFYNQFQDLIITNINTFIDNFDLYYTELIRYISNLDDSKKLVNTLLNITNLNSHITIKNQPNAVYYNIENGIKKSSIYFKIDPSFNNLSFIDNLTNFGCLIEKNNEYYRIKNIVFNNPSQIYLVPYNFTANKQFYLLMFLLNYPKNNNNQSIITEFYLTPNNYDINNNNNINNYKVDLIVGNILYLFDSTDKDITLSNTNHFLLNKSADSSGNKIIDINNILYDYSYKLYMNIKDITTSNFIINNQFAMYIDFMSFNNLWHLKQNITKKTSNGNNAGIINLYNITSSEYNYFLDCNINFSSFVDHIIINNSITSLINDYLITNIIPDITKFINNVNIYIPNQYINIINSNNINELNINVTIDSLKPIKLIYVYLNILNTIKFDIDNINYDLKFEYLVDDFKNIYSFFNLPSNITNGNNFNLSNTDYQLVININNNINDVINFIIQLLQSLSDKPQLIIMEDNTINEYTIDPINTTNNNILFKTLNLNEILYNLPLYFCNNFYNKYEYTPILSFFNKVKVDYLNTYNLLLLDINRSGQFSYNFYLNLKQYLNFSINDYEKNMNFYRKNLNYNETNDIIDIINVNYNILSRETYYKYSIIVNTDISLSYINNYYNTIKSNYDNTYNIFINYINILKITGVEIDTIITNFNTFFGFNNSFYSDNRLCSTIYFYLYNSYIVNTVDNSFNIYFNNSDNTSNLNYMDTDISNNYNFVGFIDSDNNIKYILKNNKLFDISNNVYSNNYEYKYDLVTLDDLLYEWDDNENNLIIKGNNIYNSNNFKIYYIQANNIYKYTLRNIISLDYFYNFAGDIINTGTISTSTTIGTITNSNNNTFSNIGEFNSINLNGIDQYVTIPNYTFSNKGFSISFWAKFNVLETDNKNVITFIDSTEHIIIQINVFQGNNIYFTYYDYDNDTYRQTYNYEQNGDNTWRFYTFTMSYTDTTTGVMKAYINGILKISTPYTMYPKTTSAIKILIGKDEINNYTEMSLSQLFIKNDLLSDDNIQEIYNYFINPLTSNLTTTTSNTTSIGSINTNTNIYDIAGVQYKYDISLNNTKILYPNYRQIKSISKNYNTNINNYNTIFLINDISYTTFHNIFYDTTKILQYIIYLPDTNLSAMNNFKLLDALNNISYDIIPNKLKKEITIINVDIDLTNIFENTFNTDNAQKTINYLHTDIQQNIIDENEKINNRLLFFLLNNILQNSIMSNQYNNQDIYICSSFNNYIHNHNYTSSNLKEILNWLQNYNNTNINEIKIFNQTDQTIYTISDFINSNLDLTYNHNFVPEFNHYFPINESGLIVKPKTLIEDIYYSNISHFEYMLKQSKKLKDISEISTNLNLIKNVSKLIKGFIITQIYEDISNNINIIDKSNSYFIVDNNNVNMLSNDNIDISGYYIINSNIVTGLEKNIIFNLSYDNYSIKYQNQKLYLFDTSKNIDYLITTNLEDIDTYIWDNSKNNIYYKFDNSLNTVLINVKNNNSFPNTLFIYDSYLNRINRTSFGFNFDDSFNLVYNFKYDLSYSILSRVISKFNAEINKENIFTYNNNDQINDISCNILNYNNLSNYLINQYKTIWDNLDIADDNTIYINLSKNIDIILNKEYIILQNSSNTCIYHIKNILDVGNSIIYSLEPVNINNTVNPGDNCTLLFKIKDFINLLGIDFFDDNIIFYYWETFYSSLNNIILLLNTLKDDNLIDQQFTLNGYIDKIYNKITEISKDQTLENNFFETSNIIFKKKILYGQNVFDSQDSIKSSLNNSILFYKSYKQSTNELYTQLNRPEKPKCAWIPFIGHFLVDNINLKIDDNIIEEIDNQIIHNFNFSNSTVSKDIGLNKMIGNTPDLTIKQEIIPKKTLYVPIPFFFSDKEKALPIISMLNSLLSINLKVKDINKLLNIPSNTKIKLLSKLKIKLNGSYVYLDTDERYKFAQMRHEYLIKTKKNIKYYVNQNIGSLRLDLNLPSSEMFWFYLDQSIKDTNNYWNYTGIKYKEYYWNDVLMNDYDNNDDVNQFINILSKNKANKINWYAHKNNQSSLDLNNNLSILDSNELYSLTCYLYGRTRNPNPFTSSQLVYNGHKRFNVDGIMSNLVTPLTYYRDTFPSGLNVYTFCRYPKSIKHSGSLNFKYATNINFDYSLEFKDKHAVNGEINIIICELNVLRIASGIGCVAW